MSIEALTHVLSLNVGDSTRKLVLVGYANHAHKDGTGAWAKPATVAEYANCSKRTVQRHVKVLLEDGYLREGDQGLVSHIPADRRPIVYEIAMDEATRIAWREQRAPGRRDEAAGRGSVRRDNSSPRSDDAGGDNLSPRRGDDVSPRAAADDVTPVSPRDVTPVTQRRDTAMSPEPSENQQSEPSGPVDSLRSSTAGDRETGAQEPVSGAADGASPTRAIGTGAQEPVSGADELDAKRRQKDDLARRRSDAEKITRRFHGWYTGEHGPIADSSRDHLACRGLIEKALVDYTEDEVRRALWALKRPVPTKREWQDALVAVRRGRPVPTGPGGGGGRPTNVHHSGDPDARRRAAEAWQ
jgi:hypothetical protein